MTKHYILINDNALSPYKSGRCACGDPEVYTNEKKAIKVRDELRKEHQNPNINVYTISTTPVDWWR